MHQGCRFSPLTIIGVMKHIPTTTSKLDVYIQENLPLQKIKTKILVCDRFNSVTEMINNIISTIYQIWLFYSMFVSVLRWHLHLKNYGYCRTSIIAVIFMLFTSIQFIFALFSNVALIYRELLLLGSRLKSTKRPKGEDNIIERYVIYLYSIWRV